MGSWHLGLTPMIITPTAETCYLWIRVGFYGGRSTKSSGILEFIQRVWIVSLCLVLTVPVAERSQEEEAEQ